MAAEVLLRQGLPVRLHGEFRRITGRRADEKKIMRVTLSGNPLGLPGGP
jgi:hypothetical protein